MADRFSGATSFPWLIGILLGPDTVCPATVLPAVPDCPEGGHRALRPLYEASAHRYIGPAVAPVLSDCWSGS
ncbi:hypothetical protein S1361_12600 [Streptomyces cyanogenus]|uniref:Secreted protein n=1 Tax=Streptomyces cyanogenus TaxID=80860 RepID=A0ABX7TRL9_STRCY|nr:hypothetical protein S1361_12600 [Streptomyces cyanogenus]